MNTKSLLFSLIFLWSLMSCSNKVLENPTMPADQTKTPGLKSASINYYVATTGSDSNAGTLASPFKTIQKAANVAAPGDTVIVRDGTYTSASTTQVLISRSGTANGYITFRSEHKGGAVLDGANTVGYCFGFSASMAYINISGFEIKNFVWMAISINNTANPVTDINITDNHIHDIGRDCSDSTNGKDGIFLNGAQNITIQRNTINNIGRYASGENGCSPSTQYYKSNDHGIYIDGCTGISINANIFYNCNHGWSIQVYSGNSIMSSNINIYNNTFAFGNPYYPYTDSNHIILQKGTNFNIKNNIFYQTVNAAAAIDFYSTPFSNTSVTNNIVFNGTITTTPPSGVTVSGNLTSNPLMTSPSTFDFSLQAGSPAINAGINVGLSTDFFKNAIVGLPDIGAVEYQGQGATTTYYNIQESGTATKNNCPTGSTGSTVTYTVAAGKYSSTISQTDANNQAITDVTNNKQAYANTNGTCTAATVYYNVLESGTATKNNCATGSTGSTVTYTVAAGKYSSTISQADANNQAITDVTNNKQAYANTNGTCTAATVYYNVLESGTATKNNCATGSTGSTVTYTVAAGKYSSTVSQTDANNQAINDVTNNKQAYANANGTCTAATVYYNVLESGTATKNNCGSGYTGSRVTYTVAANTYSSTISQTDANNKAIADVTNNKQTYANANGTCTRKWWRR